MMADSEHGSGIKEGFFFRLVTNVGQKKEKDVNKDKLF